MSAPLAYDAHSGGHRDRGVVLLAKIVEGTSLIAPPGRALGRLVRQRGVLLWQTADNALPAFVPICLVRSLFGRETVALCYRNDLAPARKRWRAGIRRLVLAFLDHWPLVTVIQVLPPHQGRRARGRWIYDPEWWDLAEMPVKPVPPALPSKTRPVILFVGNTAWVKGPGFFIDAAEAAAAQGSPVAFRMVGPIERLKSEDRARLLAAGCALIPGSLSDAEFLGHIQAADYLWCCYHPDYDQSSGIFGRAIQLGIAAIVRKGSMLASFVGELAPGFTVPYGDVDSLLAMLRVGATLSIDSPAAKVAALHAYSIAVLQCACGLTVGERGPETAVASCYTSSPR